MLIDLALGPCELRSADIAVVGAGAAGITLTRRLLARGLSVVLLESGGTDYERDAADLNRGESIGQHYYPLDHARLRFFGGTTAIWGGRCAEFDAVDFERRAWVTHSGWPMQRADLEPWYREARGLFGLEADWPEEQLLRDAGVPLPRFAPEALTNRLWSFDGRSDRFGFASAADLITHPRCTVVLHANVTQIVAGRTGTAINSLEVAGPDSRRMRVLARCYLLAAGGIENPRLLLASNTVQQAGLGNDRDLVGRFFMEHPHARGGRIVEARVWQLLRAYLPHRIGGRRVAALIAPAAALQARLGILNTSLTIAARRPALAAQPALLRAYLHAKHELDPGRLNRALWRATKDLVGRLQQVTDPARPWLLQKMGSIDVALVVRAEQAPNPQSRVQLDSARDAHGVPRARLDWRLSPLDVASVQGLVATLGSELARLGLGRVEMAGWLEDASRSWHTDELISAHPIGGYHHMGTTRMAAHPAQGVTDGFGRVHGIDNLYVAGSSLFPTSGWANPTLTIAALALRTAEQVAARFGQRLTPAVQARPSAARAPACPEPADAA